MKKTPTYTWSEISQAISTLVTWSSVNNLTPERVTVNKFIQDVLIASLEHALTLPKKITKKK